MKKAKIYKPTKTAMQSGVAKYNNWLLEFDTKDNSINPMMGWESSSDTLSEIKLEFSSKDLAIAYARRNKIEYYIIESKPRKLVKESDADKFSK